MKTRQAALHDLLNASRPIETLVKELSAFEWDADNELVTLKHTHVAAILADFLAGHRTASEIRLWAETIEGRDDIGISDEFHEKLEEAIFQLANPELGYTLSTLFAQKIVEGFRS